MARSICHEGVEGADNKQFFDGILDEVKLSDVARGAGWISTSYNNQSDPGAFYSVGSLELESGPPEISNPDPADGATNVSVSLSQLSFDLYDPDGDPMDYEVTTTPRHRFRFGDGCLRWDLHRSGLGGLTYDTTYTWDVSATDGSQVTDRVLHLYHGTGPRTLVGW